jgi:hypothetical protein
MIISFFLMLDINIFIGTILTAMILVLGLKEVLSKNSKPLFEWAILGFIFYNVVSGINYAFNDFPLSVYYTEVKLQIVPIFFVFIGSYYKDVSNTMYNSLLYGSIFMSVVGLYLYFVQPIWYFEWRRVGMVDWIGETDVDYVLLTMGLSSFFYTPYYTGYLALVSSRVLLDLMYKNGLKIRYIVSLLLF